MPEVIAKTEFVDARYGSVGRGDKLDVTEPAARELVEAGLVERASAGSPPPPPPPDDPSEKPPAAKEDKDPPAVKSAPAHPNKMQPLPANKAKS